MTKGLTGIPSLAYVGVNAGSPPNIKMYKRSPTTDDSKNFIIGDLWLNITPTPAASRQLWMLVALLGNYATWVQILPQTGGGGGGNLRSDDLLIEIPDPVTGAINVYGGEPYVGDPAYINMYTNRLNANTLYVNLKRSINQPNTNATATEGMYKLGSSDFMHNYGTNNTAIGHGTLNLGLTVATSTDNTACGHGALNSINLGGHNTACGSGALTNIEDGEYSIGLGFDAGANLAGADSDDIMIGSPGILGDLNTIRIGQGGVGPGLQDKCFIPAVWEGVAEPGVLTGLTLVNANGKLYVDIIAPDSVLMTDAAGNPIGIKGPKGTVLTGRGLGLADPAPAFLEFKSAGGTVGITVTPGGPDVDCINLEVLPAAGGIATLTADTGIVLPLLANINVLGANLIDTDNLVANTVTVGIAQGLAAQVIGANPGADPVWKTLGCSDGSLDVIHTAGGIDITVIGVPPVGGVNYLMDHALQHVTPTANGILIEQGANITTVGDIALSKITVSVTDDVNLPLGYLSARDNITTTAGDLIASAGNLNLPNSNATLTEGIIKLGGNRWSHNFLGTFLGQNTGNFAATTATRNLGLGFGILQHVVSGQYNSAAGYNCLNLLSSGSNNCGYGRQSLERLTIGNRNQAFGAYSGYNYTGSESDNVLIGSRGNLLGVTDNHTIRIGWDGGGDYQQQVCYIAGIHNKVPGPSAEMVTIGSDGKLGTSGIPTDGATTFVTDSGSAVVSGTTIKVLGGHNINTTGSANIVTVHLDHSILQPISLVDSSSGVYAIGATNYVTDRFLHAWGARLGVTADNTFIGYQSGRINLAATGQDNTACGARALASYILGGGNVAVGTSALTASITSCNVTAIGNEAGLSVSSPDATAFGEGIYIGYRAGSSYTTQYYNITVGNALTASDDPTETRTTRIGYKNIWNTPAPSPKNPNPVEVETNPIYSTQKTYLYGVYRKTIAYSGTPVYVDHLGKLGTEGGVAFSFYQDIALSNVTGNGTYYQIGTAAIANGGLVEVFDSTNSVSLGGMGAPAVFTAPYSGKYVFTACATYIIPAAPLPPPVPASTCTYIITSNLSYSFTAYIPNALPGVTQQVSEIVTPFIYLDAGDTVRWAVKISGTTKTIGLNNYQTGPAGEFAFDTFFTGYRMS